MRGAVQVKAECNDLMQEIRGLMGEEDLADLTDPVKFSLSVHHATILRNKRSLLAYANHRVGTMKQMRWELGPMLPDEIRSNMAREETQFFQKYDELLTRYIQETEIDIMSDLVPPQDLNVEVRVMRDCGEVMFESGPVLLNEGTTHSLPRTEVEPLVRQGYLEQIQEQEVC